MQEYELAYEWFLTLHSYLAYIVLAVLILAVGNAIMGLVSNKMFTPERDFRISLFGLILSHLMLVIGIVVYFVSPKGFYAVKTLGMGGMNAASRLLAVEHPFINILAIVLITIGWSRHKKFIEGNKKFQSIAIFYGLGLIFFLSRIPWGQWFN